VACFIYSLPITALAGMTVMFETLGWPKAASLSIAVGICVIYTMMGGLWADAVSDTIQFALMCVSLAVAIPLALEWVGGFGFTETLPPEHMTSTGGLTPWIILAWTIGALTVFVEPAFYQRIFAAKDDKSIVRALVIGIALWAAYDWGVTLIGMIARSAVESDLLPQDLEGKQAIIAVTMQTLPLGLKGLFLGGVLAAAMSSIDSYCLLASGNIVYDIWRPLSRRPVTDRMLTLATRAGVFGVMAAAVALSLLFDRITDAWVFLASVLASAVLVPVLGGVFFREATPLAGLLAASLGLGAMTGYYVLVYVFGAADADLETQIWRIGGFELFREYAVLAALPMSLVGFLLGIAFGRPRQ
jgi:SSS family solute:Na+ symporter